MILEAEPSLIQALEKPAATGRAKAGGKGVKITDNPIQNTKQLVNSDAGHKRKNVLMMINEGTELDRLTTDMRKKKEERSYLFNNATLSSKEFGPATL